MVRPKYDNREHVASLTLTLRLTPRERALLDQLVALRSRESLYGTVSAASLVRGLILEAGRSAGLALVPPTPEEAPETKTVAPKGPKKARVNAR